MTVKPTNTDRKTGRQDQALPDRIRFGLGEMSQADLARATGLPKTSIQSYLSGQMPGAVALIALSEALRLNPKWLATGEGVPDIDGHELTRVPRYDAQLAAGPGAWQDRAEQRDGLVFSKDYLAKFGAIDGDGLIILDVAGDSMEPTIRDGAVALVDTRDLRWSDGIWAFVLGDTLRVKRLRRGLRSLQVISDNPAYPPEEITAAEEDQLHLIGRVRWVGQTL